MKTLAIYLAVLPLMVISARLEANTAEDEAKAKKLVEQLASESFRTREEASKELVRLGAASKRALEIGIKSDDADVANRCRRLLPMAYEFYVQKLLNEHLANPEKPLSDELPGAKRWLATAGTSADSKSLYMEMLLKHRDLLTSIASKPETVTEKYNQFIQELYNRIRVQNDYTMRNEMLTQSEMSLFLFLTTDPKVNRDATVVGVNSYLPLTYILNQTKWTTTLSSKSGLEPYRKLFVEFLTRETNPNVLRRAIQLAATAELKESLPAMLKVAKDKNILGSIRGIAMTGIARVGGKEHLPELLPFLEDKTLVSTVRFNNENRQLEMRDVALGVLLLMNKQKLTDYGYDRNPPDSITTSVALLSSYIYYTIPSDEARTKALQLWKELAAKEKLIPETKK